MSKTTNSLLCNRDDSIVAIVDLQTRLTAAMPAKVLARLQRNAGILLRSAAVLEIPVFSTEQYPAGLGETEPEIAKLFPPGAHRYEKTSFSCAGAAGLMDDLAGTGRSQVIIAGMEAHICVVQSAVDLMTAGYQVFVVADAVCSRHRENYEAALDRLRHTGAVVSDAESILFEWLRDAKHPHFKALQAFVR